MSDNAIIPVLLGADLNCYSVARAFHEAYGVKSYAFGRYTLGATKYSKIIDFTVVEDLCDDRVMLDTLIHFAKAHPDGHRILVGCTDAYADLIIENQSTLREYYFCPCPDKKTAEKLISKDLFYRMCEKYGIDYPDTVVIENQEQQDKLASLPFSYPVIIKPASSICYWQHPFEGMKKVYRAQTQKEAEKIVSTIFSSGYDSSIIVQDLIPGDDSGMFVLTCYSDRNAKVKMMCMGHVLLEEHTPKGIGNHVAIVTEYHESVMEKMKNFLEDIGVPRLFQLRYQIRPQRRKIQGIRNQPEAGTKQLLCDAFRCQSRAFSCRRFERLSSGNTGTYQNQFFLVYRTQKNHIFLYQRRIDAKNRQVACKKRKIRIIFMVSS